MRKLSAVLLPFALTASLLAPQAAVSTARASRPNLSCAPGEVIVKLKEGARGRSLLERARELVAVEVSGEMNLAAIREDAVEPLSELRGDDRLTEMMSRRGFDRTFVLKFDPEADTAAIIARLKADDSVEYAEPNYFVEPGAFLPDDTRFSDQWGLRNLGLGVQGYPSTLDADVKATDAWAITAGSPDVIVAVTDTGVDITHPDLAQNIYVNPDEIAGNNIDDDKNGYVDDVSGYNVANKNTDVSDIVGHGTEMSGIIAARMNNGIGISGLTQSKILPVKFFKSTGPSPEDYTGTVADAARALLYSIAAKASVINASWTVTLTADSGVPGSHATALREAVDATNEAGILLVSIAGNRGSNVDISPVYPAAYNLPNQINVAASEYNDEIWHPPFDPYTIKSSYGVRTVHLVAPGVSILTTRARGSCVGCSRSQNPDDWYAAIDGSSASAAFVSGVVALAKSTHQREHPTLIRRRVLESVDVREHLRPFVSTSGRLNAVRALTIEITVTPPSLTRLKVKSSGKTFVYGEGIQAGAVLVVGDRNYPLKEKGSAPVQLFAKLPAGTFPPGVPVEVRLLNPDGGLSAPLTITR